MPVETYNAEISLLTGMCAATLMLQANYGILRTVPPPDDRVISALRRIAPALDVEWADGEAPGDVLATLDRKKPKHVAFLDHAGSLLRCSTVPRRPSRCIRASPRRTPTSSHRCGG